MMRPSGSTPGVIGDICVVPSARVVAITPRWLVRKNSLAASASNVSSSTEVPEDQAGLQLGVEEGGLRGHALATVGGGLDLGDGGGPEQHAELGAATGHRGPHVVDAVLERHLGAGQCRGQGHVE